MENEAIEKIKKGLPSPELFNETLGLLEKTFKKDVFVLSHSLRVAQILKEMGADENTIISGLLHHVPIFSSSLNFIPKERCKEILKIIKKVNKLREVSSLKKDLKIEPLKKWQKTLLDSESEKLRGMLFAITRDLRPIFIIIAEKLDEMRNLNQLQSNELKRKSIEALKIFAPLAYGIGMGKIKGQLEDLAFPRLYPKEYKWLLSNVKDECTEREKYIERVKPTLTKILENEKIETIDIHTRAKHYFSLYQKLLRYNMDIEKIYDLVALRIIVPTSANCYKTLGVIHKSWTPLWGRIKDYIASPKPNGYRSLHTTVFCQENKITEFQIKTPQMHKEAEYGAAAHLSYKEKISLPKYKHQFYWMDQLRKWKEEIKDMKMLSKYLEFELFKDQIFVITPKGDAVNLPKNATPVDFAYAIHTEIGDHCQSAKVNGKVVSLNEPLKNGDKVEILIDKHRTPSSDWLRFVKTAKAKSKTKFFLQKAYGISPISPEKRSYIKEKVSLIKEILPFKKKKEEVLIAGETGISTKLSRCCSPKPGDEVVAFITQGEGASIHKTDCKNLKYIQKKWPMKIVQASWNTQ